MNDLLQWFKNRDLSSHNFKNIENRDRESGCGGDCMKRAAESSNEHDFRFSPSTFSVASPCTNGPPSPDFSSPNAQNVDFRAMQQEIELVNPNQNEQLSSTTVDLAHEVH
ncbi:hypothetical protein ABFS83_01G038500 [Erythranthe nasuta]